MRIKEQFRNWLMVRDKFNVGHVELKVFVGNLSADGLKVIEYTVLEFKRNVDDIHDHVILPKITNGTRHEKRRG